MRPRIHGCRRNYRLACLLILLAGLADRVGTERIVLLGLPWDTIQTGAVGELDSAENPLLRPVSLKANLMPNWLRAKFVVFGQHNPR